MDNVKKHEYVQDNEEAKPIIIKALSFLYELDEIGKREIEVEKNSINFFYSSSKTGFTTAFLLNKLRNGLTHIIIKVPSKTCSPSSKNQKIKKNIYC